MDLKVNYKNKRRLQNINGETIKAICLFVNSSIKNQIKYECEFNTTGEEITNIQVLDKYNFVYQKVKFNGKSFIALKYMDNLQDSKEEIFNKNLFFLEESKVKKKGDKFNITGKLSENNFNYTTLNLEFNFINEGDVTPEIKSANCTVIHSKEKEYILECTPKNELNGEIEESYSNLGDANLFVIFKNEDNIIEMNPRQEDFNQIVQKVIIAISSILALIFLFFCF